MYISCKLFYKYFAYTFFNYTPILHQEEKILFSLLKREIAAKMMQSYPGADPDISKWKGQVITDFQEDLLIKVKGRLSEKWFYTHFKTFNPSLPRVDLLNMLSKYAGYENWDDFRFKNSDKIHLKRAIGAPDKTPVRIILILLIAVILLGLLSRIKFTSNHSFTFIDADTGEPIRNNRIQVDLIRNNESPVSYFCNENGSLVLRTNENLVKMVVRASYYLEDTIIRVLKKFERVEQIKLRADIYSLLIRYYSQNDAESWMNKRQQLDRMISEDAMIYQVPDQRELTGMEIYNKWEFIDKLTIPSSRLRGIEIINARYQDGKIVILRIRNKIE